MGTAVQKAEIISREFGIPLKDAETYLSNHNYALDLTRNTLRSTRTNPQNHQRLIANTPANPPATTTRATSTEDEELEKAIALSLATSGGGAGDVDAVDPNVDPELAQALALSRQTSGIDSGSNKPGPEVVDLTGEAGGDDLQATLLASIQTAQGRTPVISSDPTTLERVGQTPVGLKNVGNTCYLNSLIQTYFMMPIIRKAVISYKPAQPVPSATDKKEGEVSTFDKHSHEFMVELQKLFCAMVLSRQRFVDPSNLLKKIVDESGKPVNIGAQEDVSEFNDIFMMRLTKGLDLAHPPLESNNQSKTASPETSNSQTPPKSDATPSNSNSMELDPSSIESHFPSASSVTISPPQNTSSTDGSSPHLRRGSAHNLSVLAPDPADPSLSNSILLYPDATDLTNARLQRMFQPNVLEVVEARELDGTHIQQQQTVDFGRNFILPVTETENEFYSSLDKFMSDEVADWETPQKARVTASRWRWLRRAPEVLFFQQQRAVWRGDAYTKANSELKFPESLFMERYDLKHLAEVTNIRAANAGRYAQLQDLQKRIEPYMRYDNEGTPLDRVLTGSIKYLSSLAESTTSRNNDQIELMKKSIDLLRGCKEEEAKTFAALSAEKESVEKTLSASFNGLQSEPYTLFAVWVHAGAANGGHYWAYIKDAATGEWFKFNDTDCTRVDLNKVLEDGYGGQGVTSAYFLIYMKETLYDRSKSLDKWVEIIPENLRVELESDNAAFEKKVKEFRENGVDSKIERYVQGYERKWEQAKEYAWSATNEKDMRYYSIFAYLLSRGLEEDSQAALASEMWLRIFGAGISKEQSTVQFERLVTMPVPGTSTLFRAVNWNSKERDAEYKNYRSVFAFVQTAVSLLQKSDTPTATGLTEKQEALRLLYLAYIRNLEVQPENCKRNDLADLIQLALVLCLRECIELASINLSNALAILDDMTYVCLRLESSGSTLRLVSAAQSPQSNPGLDASQPTIGEGVKALILDACFTALPEKNADFVEDPKAASIQDRLIGDVFPSERRWESYAVPSMPTELDQWEAYIITARDSYHRLKKKFAGLLPSLGLQELSVFVSEKKCTIVPANEKNGSNPSGSSAPAAAPSTPILDSNTSQTGNKTGDPSNAMDTSEHENEKMAVDTPSSVTSQNTDNATNKPDNSAAKGESTQDDKQQSSVEISNAMDVDQSPKKE